MTAKANDGYTTELRTNPQSSLVTSTNAMDVALQTLQPIRDLSRNWDVDIASWYVLTNVTYIRRIFPVHE
jgi:hypothetical protein